MDEGPGGLSLHEEYGDRKEPMRANATVSAARLPGSSPAPAHGKGRAGNRKGGASLSPYDVQPRMDADMAKLMARKGARTKKSPAPRGRAEAASEGPPEGAGLLS